VSSGPAAEWLGQAPAAVARLAWVHGADELTYFRMHRLLGSIGLSAERTTGNGSGDHTSLAVALVVARGPVDWNAVARLRGHADTVVLTGEPSESGERRALDLGAIGYLPLHLADDALCKRLEAILAGQAGFSRTTLGQWLRRQATRTPPLDAPTLTPRQQQILERIARGDADKQIAQHLGIATATVQKHVQMLLRRLRVRNRAAAVRYARAPKADDQT
jgi:DNA-binding CsgD family transcriptional regulator